MAQTSPTHDWAIGINAAGRARDHPRSPPCGKNSESALHNLARAFKKHECIVKFHVILTTQSIEPFLILW